MKSLDFERGALPLYVQLEEIIRSDIENGIYARHETIPAEIYFQNEYNVSRITVRQAIAALEQQGYVERSRGRGTRVIWNKGMQEDVDQIISLTKEVNAQGRTIGTAWLKLEKMVPPAEVLDLFELTGDTPIQKLSRVRSVDGVPMVCFETWLPPERGLPENEEAYQESLYALYEQAGIGEPVRSSDVLSAGLADERIARLLTIPPGAPLLIRQRTSYNALNDVIEQTISYFRGDLYRYHLDLKNTAERKGG